jgi:hypothetical protein
MDYKRLNQEDLELAKSLIKYRKLGIRWCRLSKRYDRPVPELKRLICLYKDKYDRKRC